MVYIIQAGEDGPVKIGYSKTLASAMTRLASFQPGCPDPLRLVRILEGDKGRERELHSEFAHARIHGEWFRPLADILALGEPPDDSTRAGVRPIGFRWPEEFIALIDAARGDVPRATYVRKTLEQWLDAEQALGGKASDASPTVERTREDLPGTGARPSAPAEQPSRADMFRRRDPRPYPKGKR